MHEGQAAHRGRGDRRAVECLVAGNDLAFGRFAPHGMVNPGELDHRFIGFGARRGEISLAAFHPCQGYEFFGQFSCRRVRAVEEGMIEAKFRVLPRRRFRQPLVIEAQRGTPKPGHRVNIGLA